MNKHFFDNLNDSEVDNLVGIIEIFLDENCISGRITPEQHECLTSQVLNMPVTAGTSWKQKYLIAQAILRSFVNGLGIQM